MNEKKTPRNILNDPNDNYLNNNNNNDNENINLLNFQNFIFNNESKFSFPTDQNIINNIDNNKINNEAKNNLLNEVMKNHNNNLDSYNNFNFNYFNNFLGNKKLFELSNSNTNINNNSILPFDFFCDFYSNNTNLNLNQNKSEISFINNSLSDINNNQTYQNLNLNAEKNVNHLLSYNNSNNNNKITNNFLNTYDSGNANANTNANANVNGIDNFSKKTNCKFKVNKDIDTYSKDMVINNNINSNMESNFKNKIFNTNKPNLNNNNNLSIFTDSKKEENKNSSFSIDNNNNNKEEICDIKKVLKNYFNLKNYLEENNSSKVTKENNNNITNNYSYVLNNYNLNISPFNANNNNTLDKIINQKTENNNIINSNLNLNLNESKNNLTSAKKNAKNISINKEKEKEKDKDNSNSNSNIDINKSIISFSNCDENNSTKKIKTKKNKKKKKNNTDKDSNYSYSIYEIKNEKNKKETTGNLNEKAAANNFIANNRLRNFTCFNEQIYEGGLSKNSKKLIENYSEFYKKDLKNILEDPKHNFMNNHFSEMYEKIDNFYFNIHLLGKKRDKEKHFNSAFIDLRNIPNGYYKEFNRENKTCIKDVKEFKNKNNSNLNSPIATRIDPNNNIRNLSSSKIHEMSLNEFEIDIPFSNTDSNLTARDRFLNIANDKDKDKENYIINNNTNNKQIRLINKIEADDYLKKNTNSITSLNEKKIKMVKIWDSTKLANEKVDNLLFKIEKIWPFEEFHWCQENILEFLMENKYDIEITIKYVLERDNNFINFMSNKLIEKDEENFCVKNPMVRKPGIKKKKIK